MAILAYRAYASSSVTSTRAMMYPLGISSSSLNQRGNFMRHPQPRTVIISGMPTPRGGVFFSTQSPTGVHAAVPICSCQKRMLLRATVVGNRDRHQTPGHCLWGSCRVGIHCHAWASGRISRPPRPGPDLTVAGLWTHAPRVKYRGDYLRPHRSRACTARRATEARRRCRLLHAVEIDKNAAPGHMFMVSRFLQRKHRAHAGIRLVERVRPFVPRSLPERLCKHIANGVPASTICSRRKRVRRYVQAGQQLAPERLLNRAYRNIPAVGGLIGRVPWRAPIERVLAAPVRPASLCVEAAEERHQRGRAVHHGGINDLPLAAIARFEHSTQHAEREKHRPTAIVADKVQRRNRSTTSGADCRQRARQRNVVDVVAGGWRKRAVLPPPRHATVNEAGIKRATDVGTDPEPFHDTRPVAFQDNVCRCHQLQRGRPVTLFLEVQRDDASATHGDIPGIELHARAGKMYHVGTHIGEQHRAERYGADGTEFQHLHARQRTFLHLVNSLGKNSAG
ncbi:hypothetical protein BURMUCGD1_1782 [Burkholderia multivorans CGD1]|nr:hypothetical protein BURMUCGD1_1782 [Burkholderia multivorans CGD1]